MSTPLINNHTVATTDIIDPGAGTLRDEANAAVARSAPTQANDDRTVCGPRPPRPTNLRLDDQLCFALYAATNNVIRTYRPLLDRIGLTYPQYLVMLVLWEADDCPVRHIAQRLELPANALSPLLDRLSANGLLTRVTDPADRRAVRVRLTPAGLQLEHAAGTVQNQVACGTPIDDNGMAALRAILRRLHGTPAKPARPARP